MTQWFNNLIHCQEIYSKIFTHYQWAIQVAAATWSVVWWQVSSYLLRWFVTISWKSEFLLITLTTPVTSALNFTSSLSLGAKSSSTKKRHNKPVTFCISCDIIVSKMRYLLNHMKVKHNYPSDPLFRLNDSGVLAATTGQPKYLHETQMLLSKYSNAKTFLASLTSILTAGMPPPANLLCFS